MKNLKTSLCIAAAAFALASCSSDEKEIIGNSAIEGTGINIVAQNPDIVNNTRTALVDENGKISPVWTSGDLLLVSATQDGAAVSAKFNNTNTEASKTTSFAQQGSTIDFSKATDVFAVHYKINPDAAIVPAFEGNKVRILYDNGTTAVTLNKEFYKNDFMVSKKIADPAAAVADGKLTMSFKRLSSVVRVSAVGPSDGSLKDDQITKIELYTYNAPLSGFYDYDFDTESGQDGPRGGYFQTVNFIEGAVLPFDGKTKAYFCMKPSVIKSDDQLTLVATTKEGRKLIKKINIPESGILFESGKITTINLNFTEKEGNPETDVTVNVGDAMNPAEVISHEAGRMKYKHFEKAMGSSNELSVSGDINASDLLSLRNFLISPKNDGKSLALLMRDANIIGGDNSEYYNEWDTEWQKIPSNNVLTSYIFRNCDYISFMMLPAGIEEIQRRAISSDILTHIVFDQNIKKIAADAVKASTTKPVTVEFNVPYSDTLQIDDDFINVAEGSILILDASWKGHVTGNVWKGITWGEINFKGAIS